MTTINKISIKDIAKIAIVMALYIVLTIAISPLSYGPIQFRFAEILILLCFFDHKYGWSLIFGCLIANIFSTLGLVDMIFGTIATLLSVILVCKIKNIWIASLFPALFNGIIVGLELHLVEQVPLLFTMLQVFIGELVVVTIVGCPLFIILMKNSYLKNLI